MNNTKKWFLRHLCRLTVVPALLLVLLLMGCPTTTGEGVESGDDGSVSKDIKPEIPWSESADPGSINNVHWRDVAGGSTYGVEVAAGKWDFTETIYQVYYRVMYDWATIYANYKVVNHGMNGAGTTNDGKIGYKGSPNGAEWNAVKRPVAGISLRDAIVFCNALSEAAGKEPVYLNKDGDILKDASKEVEKYVVMSKTANGYRLPTVDEFIYAANYKEGGSIQKDTLPTYSLTLGQGWGTGASAQVGDDYDAQHEEGTGATKTINSKGLAYLYGGLWEWCFNFDGTYGLMGGDIWTQGETPQPYDWTPRKPSDGFPATADDPGSKKAAEGPSYGLRVRTNLAE